MSSRARKRRELLLFLVVVALSACSVLFVSFYKLIYGDSEVLGLVNLLCVAAQFSCISFYKWDTARARLL